MQRFQRDSGTISRSASWSGWRNRAVLLGMAAALISVVLHAYVLTEAEAEDAASGSADIRVSVRALEDERVEVALQQADGGTWGERQLPTRRFLPAGAPHGEWRSSSAVTVRAGAAGPMPASMPEDAPLYCVVHHGADDDQFWVQFDDLARFNARQQGLTNLQIIGKPDVAEQAAAIRDCAERGAVAIASSIPDIDGLRETLLGVKQRGIVLYTFNSGVEVADQAGSLNHYGLDDVAAGEAAGSEFEQAGLTGTVLCLLHERANVGLADRCDGLEDAYGGDVERVQLPAGSLADPATAGRAIGAAIAQHDAAGVLLLNGALVNGAMGAVQFLGGDVKLGLIGTNPGSLLMVEAGRLLFAVNDGVAAQANLVVLALQSVDASAGARATFSILRARQPGVSRILIRPLTFNQAFIDSLPEDWLQSTCDALERAGGWKPPACD